MKAANFLNILLATAVVLLCAKLYRADGPAPAGAGGQPAAPAVADGPAAPGGTVVVEAGGATGYGGPVPVVVEVKDGVVAKVSPKLPNDETPMFFKKLDEAGLWQAWNGMEAGAAVTAEVDAVASATYSSRAAIANVRAALAEAAGGGAEGAAADAGSAAPPEEPPRGRRGHGPHGGGASDYALSALGPGAAEAIAAAVPGGGAGGEGGPAAARQDKDGENGEK